MAHITSGPECTAMWISSVRKMTHLKVTEIHKIHTLCTL